VKLVFGAYEIIRDGRAWHGNVRVAEHHLAEREGEYALFRVEDIAALPVSAPVAKAIAALAPGFSSLIPDAQMQALRATGLVADPGAADGAATAEAPPSPGPSRLVNMVLVLAQTCNMRCTYCLGGGGEYGRPGMLSEQTAIAAVDWFLESSGDASRVQIGFAGGEPLLAFPLLQRVVTYAREQAGARGKVVTFGLNTNGSLLTDQVVAFLAKEGIVPTISFDGPAAVQDRQRPFRNGKGSFERVRRNVRRLSAVMPDLTAQATVCAGSDPFAIRRALEEAGFRRCVLNRPSPALLRGRGGARTGAAADAPATRELQEAAERMTEYRRAEVDDLFTAVRARDLAAAAPTRELRMLTHLAAGRRNPASCAVGRGVVAVAADGGVYPCPSFLGVEEMRLGDIGDCGVQDMDDRRTVVENLPACRRCWARYLCGGGCSYDNLARTGDIRRPDPHFCRETMVVCEDLVAGWCRLGDEDRAHVRALAARPDPAARP
jgi:uncharacterized protein